MVSCVEALSVVSEPELAIEAEDGNLTFVFDFHVIQFCVVPIIQKVETEPMERMSLLPCGSFLVGAPLGMLMITCLLLKIRSLSFCNMDVISSSALVIMHFWVRSHQTSLA